MIFKRELGDTLLRFSKFPIVGVFGPRQSGKTTLVKTRFDKHKYLNFEDPNIRSFAADNPRGFLLEYENEHGIILDEFQYVPQILSYIQLEADAKDRPGYFVLTGSQNFLMNQAITQSLAGRVGISTLLPLSIKELQNNELIKENVNELIFKGGYPRLYSKDISPLDLYPSYIHSYVERDIRLLVNSPLLEPLLKPFDRLRASGVSESARGELVEPFQRIHQFPKRMNVENLETFQRFMQLCAARIGQLLNISDLALSCGIDQKTVKRWLSILEASYIIFLLNPYHVNFNKRLTKSSKLFFYDTGLACSLLKIRSSEELALSSFKGHLFEGFIVADIFKQYFNTGAAAPIYFWRDLNGRIEVDCLIDLGIKLVPVEIKSGESALDRYFDSLNLWNSLANSKNSDGYVVYGGQHSHAGSLGNLVSWLDAGNLVQKLSK